MNGTSGFQAGCGKTILAQQRFDGLHVWDKRRTPSQDAQKGRPARPQQAKWRCVLCSVRGASERSENAAGGLFQHPAGSAVFYLPITITHRFLHEQRINSEKVPGAFSGLMISSLSPKASVQGAIKVPDIILLGQASGSPSAGKMKIASYFTAGVKSSLLGISLLLCLALTQSSCASFLGFPSYFDATTYKSLTDLKAEILFLYDTFATDSLDEAEVTAVRLKLAQVYEYEKGKGEKNKETREQLEIIQQLFGRHVSDRVKNGKWPAVHLANQKTNLAEAFDIAISTERLKNKNE